MSSSLLGYSKPIDEAKYARFKEILTPGLSTSESSLATCARWSARSSRPCETSRSWPRRRPRRRAVHRALRLGVGLRARQGRIQRSQRETVVRDEESDFQVRYTQCSEAGSIQALTPPNLSSTRLRRAREPQQEVRRRHRRLRPPHSSRTTCPRGSRRRRCSSSISQRQQGRCRRPCCSAKYMDGYGFILGDQHRCRKGARSPR